MNLLFYCKVLFYCSRFSCVPLVVETFSDRVAFRILPNISDGAPLQKQPTALTVISRCLAFEFVSLCSMLCFFSPYMNLFCTFVCLTFFKFVNIFLQKFRSSRLEVQRRCSQRAPPVASSGNFTLKMGKSQKSI